MLPRHGPDQRSRSSEAWRPETPDGRGTRPPLQYWRLDIHRSLRVYFCILPGVHFESQARHPRMPQPATALNLEDFRRLLVSSHATTRRSEEMADPIPGKRFDAFCRYIQPQSRHRVTLAKEGSGQGSPGSRSAGLRAAKTHQRALFRVLVSPAVAISVSMALRDRVCVCACVRRAVAVGCPRHLPRSRPETHGP